MVVVFKLYLEFLPRNIGEMESSLTSVFLKWFGSTTKYKSAYRSKNWWDYF